jgi:predicted metalloprotease with PDZ domain
MFDLGAKELNAWKANPSQILPMKTFLAVNNIKISSNIKNAELAEILSETLADFKYFARPTELVLLFAADSLSSGGVFYDDLAIVYIDSKTSGEDAEFNMQKTILHELYHGVSPYEIYPELEARELDKNWLSEATPEYLSLKYMLKNKLIKEEYFLSIMEQKMRIGKRFRGLSLDVMSSQVYRNSNFYAAFYSKGCVAFWLLDLKLYEMTDGKIEAIDLINGAYPNLNENTQLQIRNVMTNMEQELIFNIGPFPINKYISSYGLRYDKQIVLPFKKKSETAEVRSENITFNKAANGEQKSLWKRFTAE